MVARTRSTRARCAPCDRPALQATVVAVVVGPLWLDVSDHHSRWSLVIDTAVCAYPVTFISTFFNAAYDAQIDAEFRRDPIGARQGLSRSAERLPAIAAWTLLTTGIGLALRGIEELPYAGSVVGRIVTSVLDAGWAVASFFVVPSLALDGTGVRDSIRHSVTTIRSRWGEAATGTVAIEGAGLLLIVPILLGGGLGYVMRDAHPLAGDGLLAATGVALAVVIIVQETVTEAFRVAVFRHAAGEPVAAPFTESQLAEAFRPRCRRWS